MVVTKSADILENSLRHKGEILDILLIDRTTNKKIIWATDSYKNQYGEEFAPTMQIRPDLVTGDYGSLIQPRAVKSREEQIKRTREKGEVFTPLSIVDQMNRLVETSVDESDWQDYVAELKLEITCGEAPFIVTRYNPVAHGAVIKLENRVGFLDRKLRIVSKYCNKRDDWLYWAKEAYKSSYGYEWQGDNVLIARENLLYTLIDYYEAKFNRKPPLDIQNEFAEIISWNIFQMDGLKYVVPMSCKHETKIIPGELALFWETPDTVEKYECEGCKFSRPLKHNGRYVKIRDWNNNKTVRFVSLLT